MFIRISRWQHLRALRLIRLNSRNGRTAGILLQSLFAAIATLMLTPSAGMATDIATKPRSESGAPIAAKLDADWLVDPAPYRAVVHETERPRELVLDNGLARRTIRLAPNAATVGLDNLVSGESHLRAVGPEGRIVVGGEALVIGGLTGQPVKNYLKAEWLDALRPIPGAYRFVRWTEGPIEAPFPWKPRREWLSRDLPWPPPGRHVTLHFAPPDTPAPLDAGPLLFSDKFSPKLADGWTTHVSDKHPRSSFAHEGQPGALFALPDTCAYAERAWPRDAVSVELRLDVGDDRLANSWGPGLALVAADRTLSLVARPHSQQFEVVAPELGERLVGRFDRARPVTLRVVLNDGRAKFFAATDDEPPVELADVELPRAPEKLRVGKVGKGGRGTDYPKADGEPARSRLHRVELRGAEPPRPPAPRADLPNVEVHYELYDGLPLLAKWLVVKNSTTKPIRLDTFVAEELRIAEVESTVESPPDRERPNLWVETDYAFGAMDAPHAVEPSVRWLVDPDYETQVHYDRQTPCLLRCQPPLGPRATIEPGASLASFRVFELLLDSTERERRGLAQRRMYRTIAPWTAENPLMFHVRGADPASVRSAIEQCRETGFELIIMTFGSGFNFESRDPRYVAQYKELAAEAKRHSLALGGYSLLASRGAADPRDNTQGQPAKYGVMPCLGSNWGRDYLARLSTFLRDADLGVLEHDGSYPGDRCAAHDHPGHAGLEDSQWAQWRAITSFYRQCRAEGVFLNIPDWYFLSGGNKCGMGYRETNWSLPRAEQEIIERQNIYDGTWTKTQSMGWMMVPLTEYHGGGPAATIEPLHQHLEHYEARFANLLGAGAQACYRGPRLYDTEDTKRLVQKWTAFYKRHRQVLDGDLIHLRRADGRDWDGWLHVNPGGREAGLAMLYNPLPTPITRTFDIPLHYTGLATDDAVAVRASLDDAPPIDVALSRRGVARLELTLPARARRWVVFQKP